MATNIIDGGGSVGGNVANWLGPFNPGEVANLSNEYFEDVTHSQPLVTTNTIANGLVASDPPWWSVNYQQIVDGGLASTGSYSNVIDGGAA